MQILTDRRVQERCAPGTQTVTISAASVCNVEAAEPVVPDYRWNPQALADMDLDDFDRRVRRLGRDYAPRTGPSSSRSLTTPT